MIAYAISDPATLHFDHRLFPDLSRIAARADWLLYRDKENPNYAGNARKLAHALKAHPDLKLFIHDDLSLAMELGVAGIHFSGRGSGELERAKSLGLFCIVSSHSISEASGFAERGADAVTLSPIFSSPGKGEPLGVETLEEAVKVLPIAVIALGGIVDGATLETVRRSGAAGFASIRYFS